MWLSLKVHNVCHVYGLFALGARKPGYTTGYTHLNNTAAKLEANGEILEVLHFRFFMTL